MESKPSCRHPKASRRAWLALGLLSAALAGCASPNAVAGGLVDVEIVDRETGQVLPVYPHQGRRYVAGRPGARYAIRITNRSAGRVLAVTSVDGVNVVSGQTAAWGQTGYVLGPWQSYELTGWRKSDQEVAAFEFTALPDAYAARTGRPLDVGVIGVAVFRERVPPVLQAPPTASHDARSAPEGRRAGDEPSGRQAAEAPAARLNGSMPRPESRARLGTGHGEREASQVTRTAFERASAAPAQVVSLHYDRYANLVAAGIVPGDPVGRPRPFPGQPDVATYVPDPPSY